MVRIRKVISGSSSKSDKVRMSFKVISRPESVKVNVKSRKKDHDEVKKLIIKVKFHVQGQTGGKIMGL